MSIITIISYVFTIIFFIFLYRAVTSVMKHRQIEKRSLKMQEQYEKHREFYLSKGLKEFTIGSSRIMAKNYKEANAEHQKLMRETMKSLNN